MRYNNILKNKFSLIVGVLLSFFGIALFSQEQNFSTPKIDLSDIPSVQLPDISAGKIEQQALIAMMTRDYPVTTGDVYNLQYLQSYQVKTLSLFVENDFTINLTIFGTINARGMTFSELKKEIERIVLDAYPDSSPQLILKSPGVFNVLIKGEVSSAQYASAWGLTTVGEIIKGKLTNYSSTRNVEIVSLDGTSREYDLFLATREGKLSENPYVRPGDTVIVHEAERTVRLRGEVKRSGTYQLLPEDNFDNLIEYYGDGFTQLAEKGRIIINRLNSEEQEYGETIYLNANKDDLASVKLRNLDIVTVPSKQEELPMVVFKGAVGFEGTDTPLFSQTVPYKFNPGERLSTAVAAIRDKLTPMSDLQNAYLVREGEEEKTFINLKALIENSGQAQDVQLKPNDTIVIPFKQLFVLVGGEVQNPGKYPYIPNRTWKYYVGLAGGFDQENHIGEAVIITDIDNNRKSKDEIIEPEDKIIAPINHPLYYIGRWVLPVTVASSVVALIMSIISLAETMSE